MARNKEDGAWQDAYIQAVEKCYTDSVIFEMQDISRDTPFRHRKKDPEFAKREQLARDERSRFSGNIWGVRKLYEGQFVRCPSRRIKCTSCGGFIPAGIRVLRVMGKPSKRWSSENKRYWHIECIPNVVMIEFARRRDATVKRDVKELTNGKVDIGGNKAKGRQPVSTPVDGQACEEYLPKDSQVPKTTGDNSETGSGGVGD